MILKALRTTLRGWLQDAVTVQWTDAQLDRFLNLGLREVQKYALAVDPEKFKCTYITSTIVPATGRDDKYSWPVGTMAVFEVALSSDGVSYAPLRRTTLRGARDNDRDGGDIAGFIPFDAKHFVLYPPTSVAVTNGMRIIVCPTLVIADDTQQTPLPLAYETMHLKQSQVFALYDVGEPTDKLVAEIENMKREIPRYELTASEPAFFIPQIDRGDS